MPGERPSFDLARRARETPRDAAVIDERGGVLSWGDLAERASRAAAHIERQVAGGAPVEAPVAFVAHPSVASFVVIHALLGAGRAMLPLHPRLARSESDALCASLGAGARLDVDAVVDDAPGGAPRTGEGPGIAIPDDERPLAVLPTSGTSASPKGVVLPRRAFAASAAASASNLPLTPRHRWLACMPLAHAGGLSIVTRTLAAGAGVVLLPRFEAGAVLDAIGRHGATHLSVVPTMLHALLEHPDHVVLRRLDVVLVGGAACPVDLLGEARRRGVAAVASYGLTEACSQVTTQPLADVTASPEGDSGLPLPGIAIAVRGAGGTHLGPEREGEIVVRGPTMMRRYVGAAPLEPGAWFATGDVGLLRADGRLVVLARRTDLIVTGGENVAPAAVEAALGAHPAVREVVVFGVDDARWGQRVAAVLVAAAGGDLDLALGEVAARLPSHARPRLVAVVDGPLPRTSKGDLDRAAARRRWSARLRGIVR